MNPVEIEEAVSALAERAFEAATFPYAFLEAFGRKETTLKRLRSGEMNKSDLGGVLQRDHIHIAIASPGEVGTTMRALRESPATLRWKAKFIVATDGETFEAEELGSDEAPIVCAFSDFHNHFAVFLTLAGISTVKQIRESGFDIKATGRLNRLYVELLKDNPDWDTVARRQDMNHFMARLIFCFFAEDTGIFVGNRLFTDTVTQMSARDASDTHTVISTIFQAMNTKVADRARLKRWADPFPYVNGGLFSGSTEVPHFSKMARKYLLNVGELDWQKINPDIFGSMIQAVADDEERGALGMHYTSVPNILKVLNPLFLDDLREKLEEAGDNSRKLLNLRNRMAKIRVFDPACGSGNFLVIAYKEMRAIEALINQRRGEPDRATDIPLTNFRGIELRSFPAEIARLALIIAEYQCDELYRGPKMALAEFLPLDSENWITCGNALRLDWLSICPPTGTGVKFHADDLFSQPLEQAQIDFENEGGETYICGNPPYVGSSLQTDAQKDDLDSLFSSILKSWKNIDYIAGWFLKSAEFTQHVRADFALVSTNSICQGQQVSLLWPIMFEKGIRIHFAYTSFKWSNLATNNAGVTVIILGGTTNVDSECKLFYEGYDKESIIRQVKYINAYLVPGENIIISPKSKTDDWRGHMVKGNMPSDGGFLVFTRDQSRSILNESQEAKRYIRDYVGSHEFIHGEYRNCLWIEDNESSSATTISSIKARLDGVRSFRETAKAATTRPYARYPHKFRQIQDVATNSSIIVPRHSSESRNYLPVGLLSERQVVSDSALVIYDAPVINISIIASRLHLVWIATVCGKLETRYRYSSTLGWNTFPVPTLTEKNKADLTRCAENILLAREAHFPATIADLYDPETMPDDLRAAHESNDEVLERIYIGRRFKNDTERLEKLFDLYTKMTAAQGAKTKTTKAGARS